MDRRHQKTLHRLLVFSPGQAQLASFAKHCALAREPVGRLEFRMLWKFFIWAIFGCIWEPEEIVFLKGLVKLGELRNIEVLT